MFSLAILAQTASYSETIVQLTAKLRLYSLSSAEGGGHALSQTPACLDRVEVHEGQDKTDVAQAIDQLAGRAISTPFQRRAWMDSWQRWIGEPQGKTQIDVIGYRAGAAVLVLPLSLHSGRGIRHISWRADDLNDYCGPIADPEILQSLTQSEARTLVQQTAKAVGGADVAYLQKQPRRYGTVPNPFVSATSIKYHANVHATHLGTTWEAYYHSKRSAKTRRRLKEKLNALSKRGAITIRFSEDPAEAAGLIGKCLDMKNAQLRQRGHWNHLSSSGATAHVTNYFADHCREKTWVAALFLNGTPSAISFGFRDPEMWLLYQIAREDDAHSSLSPGTHLLMFIMRHCCEKGVKVFDFSLGDEAYKKDWCEETSALMTDIYPLSLRGSAASLGLRMEAHIHNFIVSRPVLHERARHFKNWLQMRKSPIAVQNPQ